MGSGLRKFVAPEVVFGEDSRLLAGGYAQRLGIGRCLLVTDSGVEAAGWADEATASLREAGLDVVRFAAVSSNPRDHETMAGAELYVESQCDGLLTVGGGSVIDCAKGIGIVCSNALPILEFAGVDRVAAPMPPLLCIPTTSGTAADVSQFAIINDVARRTKVAIISKAVVPDVSLVDPLPLTTMDAHLTACTGVDALCHAFEAYASNAASPLTDLHALEAVRLIARALPRTLEQPDDMAARVDMMMASTQAGLAFSNASLGAVHAMAHSLGGYLDLPHGECNALLLPHVAAYNYEHAAARYDHLGRLLDLGMDQPRPARRRDSLVERLLEFRTSLGIAGGLAERGVSADDVALMADKALVDPCNATNPRLPSQADLTALYREAM